MKFFDSHAHLTDAGAYEDIDQVVTRAKDANVNKIINICTDMGSLERGLRLSQQYEYIYNTAATIPHDLESEGELFFPLVDKSAQDKKLVAIGETGLDYLYGYSHKDLQKKFLTKYFELALKHNLPIIIHCRDAFGDLFEISDRTYKQSKAVLHCFTGTADEVKEVINRNWMVSFSGIVTFKNNEDLRSIVKLVPLEKLLIETDSPLLAPQSKRGKKNEPANVVEVAKTISGVKNMSLNEIAKITYENAVKFFSITE